MKKIWIFTTLLFSFSLLPSCKVLQPVKKHENTLVYFYTKPVGIDPSSVSNTDDDGKTYLVEGYLADGQPVLAFVKPTLMKKLLNLKWIDARNGIASGYVFTADYLGQKSWMSKDDVEDKRYDDKQRQMLSRHRDTEKYELLSEFGPYSIKGKIDMMTGKITAIANSQTPVLDQTNPGASKNWWEQ